MQGLSQIVLSGGELKKENATNTIAKEIEDCQKQDRSIYKDWTL